MIPYLLLPPPFQGRIRREVHKHARVSEAALAVRAVIEEFGDDFAGIMAVIDRLETRGDLIPGLQHILRATMEGTPPPSRDWRLVCRSVAGHH